MFTHDWFLCSILMDVCYFLLIFKQNSMSSWDNKFFFFFLLRKVGWGGFLIPYSVIRCKEHDQIWSLCLSLICHPWALRICNIHKNTRRNWHWNNRNFWWVRSEVSQMPNTAKKIDMCVATRSLVQSGHWPRQIKMDPNITAARFIILFII